MIVVSFNIFMVLPLLSQKAQLKGHVLRNKTIGLRSIMPPSITHNKYSISSDLTQISPTKTHIFKCHHPHDQLVY